MRCCKCDGETNRMIHHEVRNAVLSIKAMVILLGKRDKSPDTALALHNIEEQCKRIMRALDKI